MSGQKIIDGLNDALAFINGDTEAARVETRLTRWRPVVEYVGPIDGRDIATVLELRRAKPEQGDGR